MSIESLSVLHSVWWNERTINSKGENVALLQHVKDHGGPVIEHNGELLASINYHWEYDTNLLSTKITWWRK